MNKFLIITNNEKEKNVHAAKDIISKIEGRGGVANWAVMPPRTDMSPIVVEKGTECIMTVGGDGTVIRSAQRTIGSGVPLIGYNLGHLGYLCDINESNFDNALDLLFENRFSVEDRMMLEGTLDTRGRQEKLFALNDVVLTAPSGQSVANLTISVNGTYLYSFIGDGLILATPTGSTAYNLSANGPIVEPTTKLIVMTPLNPHTLNSRSIILDSSDEITVEIKQRRSDKRETVDVAFDGAHRRTLHIGQKLVVKCAYEYARIIRMDNMSFLERMKERLQTN